MKRHFHPTDHPGVLVFGDLAAAGSDRQGQSKKRREVNMDVEQVGLKAGEAIRHRDQFLAQRVPMLQALLFWPGL